MFELLKAIVISKSFSSFIVDYLCLAGEHACEWIDESAVPTKYIILSVVCGVVH